MDLSSAIDEFVTYRAGTGSPPNTVKAARQDLQKFLASTGNIQLRSLGPHHGEMFLTGLLGKGYKPTTVNRYMSSVKAFCKWARGRRLMGANQDPLVTCRHQKVVEEPRRRIPVKDFARLLDAAEIPQERIILALGLYLFLRSSEIVGLRLEHCDLDAGEMKVWQPKTKRWDVMPICKELDLELRTWLTWYANDVGQSLQGEWYLVPARKPRRVGGEQMPGPDMKPNAPMSNTSLKVQRALREIGWTVKGEDMEGIHTLRRSGARALFDELEGKSRDGALRYVASMLHHKSVVQTERYLGLDVDREKRDMLLRGEQMFTLPDSTNVVPLGVAK